MILFEFRADGAISFEMWANKRAASGRARRMVKNGASRVDFGPAGDEPWSKRYFTTALPCQYALHGTRQERLTPTD